MSLASAPDDIAQRLQALEAELAQRNAELAEAVTQQAATADVLRAISGSAFDLDTVLTTLIRTSIQLCEATRGVIWLSRDGQLFLAAHFNYPEEWVAFAESMAITPAADAVTTSGLAAFTGEVVNVEDVLRDPRFQSLSAHKLGDYRAGVAVPMKRDGKVVGVISLSRPEARLFSDRQLELLQTFADQAVIAIENSRLLAELEAKNRDVTQALEQQTATAEVLKTISGSAFDLDAVLHTLVQSASDLCHATSGCIYLREGDVLQVKAQIGWSQEFEEYIRANPTQPGRHSASARVALTGSIVHIPDVLADPEYTFTQGLNLKIFRTVLGVPLLRDGRIAGVFVLTRPTVRPFTQREIELVQTFSDQAVIAIENVRLFDEVQAKNRDLTEALEQQVATGAILSAIAASPTDVQPVLKAVAESAAQLCDAFDSILMLRQRDLLHIGAHHGPIPVDFDSFPVGREWVSGRAVVDKVPVHVHDLMQEAEEFPAGQAMSLRLGHRTILAVPLLREGEAIGSLVLRRIEVRPFGTKQIELLKTFADQSVIAIENVRLFEEVQARTAELGEALEQQTATADVLKVISRSAFDLTAVLQTLIDSACKLCGSDKGGIYMLDNEGDAYRLAANYGMRPESLAYEAQHTNRVGRDSYVGRTALEKAVVHVPDVRKDLEYGFPELPSIGGFEATLSVPLMREGIPIGVFSMGKAVPGPFSPRQIELVQTFADQAVIAIENVRLFDEVQTRTAELSEALQQQLATADVLQVISRATFNLPTVLDTLVSSAIRLCNSTYGVIYLREGDALAAKALVGATPADAEIIRGHRLAFDRRTISGRTALTGTAQNVPDVLADPEYEFPTVDEENSVRAVLAVPLLRDNKVDGVFFIGKAEPGSFTDRQRELVQTFADQAVIAIENVRLFEELQAKTRDLEEALTFQKATSDVLEVIGRSASQLQPVLDIIVETAATLCRADMSVLRLLRDDGFHLAASNNRNDVALAVHSQRHVIVPDRSSVAGRVALDGRTIHIHDVAIDPEYTFLNAMSELPVHTTLGVPLIQDGVAVGVIILLRKEVDPFTERQIGLVQTFADQAVIALANVQLFDKVEARTRDLARSLDDLRAAQNRLIQTEKLASLGQLTAGIAHEIKNPLNFVSNFSSLSVELIGELGEVLAAAALDDNTRAEVSELAGMLKGNLDKVVQHGKRADSIVKNMLLHSREGSGEHRLVDLNAVVEESFNLAYHGARAEKPGFNVTLKIDLDPDAGDVDLYPQEITRVLLNLISNGFYATSKRAAEASGGAYEPVLAASTRNLGDSVEIRIRDNGTGIPPEVKEKMFNPFFTTKPAGEGTGLGLSLSHDIIVKQHAGTIEVDTEPGLFTEFRIVLPRGAASLAKSGGRA